jgi:hypothetical protein
MKIPKEIKKVIEFYVDNPFAEYTRDVDFYRNKAIDSIQEYKKAKDFYMEDKARRQIGQEFLSQFDEE